MTDCCCRYGSHIQLQSTLFQTICHDNCKCCQIYLGNKLSYQCRDLSFEDKQMTYDYCMLHNKSFYVHCPLITNLAKSDDNDPINIKTMNIIAKELLQIQYLPAACVLHIGHGDSLNNITNRLNYLDNANYLKLSNTRVNKPLLLEVAAGQKNELGKTLEEVRHIFEGLDKNKIGICLDTQHLYASSMCNFNNHESVVKLFDDIESITSIGLVHLNDSKKEFGSKVDRHASLGNGYIWSRDMESLHSIINICTEKQIDIVTETDDSYNDELLIKSIINV